jgi:hypothetical protein
MMSTSRQDPDSAYDPAGDLQLLRQGIQALTESIKPLSTEAFLRPVTEWSPRDVMAHLIGWNMYTLDGCRDVLCGIVPFYLADAQHDFRHVNAASVQRYSATVKGALLDELHATADALLSYLSALPAATWDRDYGVREPDGQPLLIRKEVAALAADYSGHAHEVVAWTRR